MTRGSNVSSRTETRRELALNIRTAITQSPSQALRLAGLVLFVSFLFLCAPRATAQTCGTPGQQGNGGTLTGVINTYYPGTATANAGTASITLGASRGSTAPIANGNLLLVMQMQDAAINSTNTGAYGDGVANDPASGYSAANNSGRYEFVRATNAVPVGGGTVTFVGTGTGSGLLNTYTNSAATATQGQRRFQVVRVPQYTVAILSSTLTAATWNGTTGGILALDVSQQLTLGGTVSVNGLGFRGGATLQLAGGAGGANTDYINLATTTFGASKGEGIAGTPRYVWDAVAGAVVDTGVEGYPNGSRSRGAPGNAGGGGTDGNPTANDENAGGGGGGNRGAGGVGGNSWNSNLVSGGFGGAIFAQFAANRIVLGGGGGGGTRNNTPGVAAAGTAAAGGGIVIIRARTVAGTGTINADGSSAFNDTLNDGAGGGGAGGSIIVAALTGGLTGLTVNARGGRGGDAWRTEPPNGNPGERHGPGGGGGGGFIQLTSAPAASNVTGGANGISTTSSSAFGAAAGANGAVVTNITALQIPGVQSGAQCSPTAVKLKTFEAVSYDDSIAIVWQTGYEVDNLGFQIYREQYGQRTRITPSFIAGSALMTAPGVELTAGYSYSWKDRLSKDRADGVSYWLEDVDLDGTSTWYGPITPRKAIGSSPDQAGARLLNDLSSLSTGVGEQREWPAADTGALARPSGRTPRSTELSQWTIAGQPAVKISIDHDAWYRVTRDELLAAGLNANADPTRLQLFEDGVEQAIAVNGDGSIEFYGRALDTPSTATHVYWLIAGATQGRRIQQLNVGPYDSGIEPSSFAYTIERRDRVIRFAALLNGEADNFFGPVISSLPVDQALRVRDRSSSNGTAVVEVALQGLTNEPHQVRVSLNGSDIGVITFQNRERTSMSFSVQAGVLQDGDNIVTLSRESQNPTDVSLIDYVRITYARDYRAENNRLRFSVDGGRAVKVYGFTSARVRLMDVTNPLEAKELLVTSQRGANGVSFTIPAVGGDRSLVAWSDEIDRASSVTANSPSTWNSPTNSADLVIITHAEFRQAIEPLQVLRQRQGLRTVVVNVEDIFDEFSNGAYDPRAIRSFLFRAMAAWQRTPRYVLLVGDATFDPRHYLGAAGGDIVPGLLVDTSFMEATSDDALADFDGDGLAEMSVGRLPARTVADAVALVSKIVAYDQDDHGDTFERGALMVSDRLDGFNFRDASDQLSARLPAGMFTQSINRDDGDVGVVRGRILAGINRGPLLVNYLGHGSVGVWTGDGLLSVNDASSFSNGPRLSFFVMGTCLNGSYMELGTDSLGEAVLKAPNGGAVGAWASSALTEPGAQVSLTMQLYGSLFGQSRIGQSRTRSGERQPAIRLGDAIRAAKQNTADIDIRRTWILLGDPTMRLK